MVYGYVCFIPEVVIIRDQLALTPVQPVEIIIAITTGTTIEIIREHKLPITLIEHHVIMPNMQDLADPFKASKQ